MSDAVVQVFPIGAQWPTLDPFLFVAHHLDHYPAGNEQLGPAASLVGRDLGQDFSATDGWSMYHGSVVPGFPQHPHRGFETITHLRSGRCDHADSMAATARFGPGDTQWMTAGAGVQHAEMFPLVDPDGPNPLELFQIWLNLPAADKMVDPYFTMLWREDTPRHVAIDANGNEVEVTVIAGSLPGSDLVPLDPPPNSWAARPEADVAVWHMVFEPNAEWVLPAASGERTQRVLYAFAGSDVVVGHDATIDSGHGFLVDASQDLSLVAGAGGVEIMLLQGRPLEEPVAQHGPFVMNSDEEIRQAVIDYQRTQFGGWPWPSPGPDHGRDAGRFAVHAGGRREDRSD